LGAADRAEEALLSFLRGLDWITLALVGVLSSLGLLALYSASFSFKGGGLHVFLRQLVWFGVGFIFYLLSSRVEHRRLVHLSGLFYVVLLSLLALVLAFGRVSGGSSRWLSLGPVNLQPSELGKVVLPLVLAAFWEKRDPRGLVDLSASVLLVALPASLVLLQPDLGTALVYAFIWLCVTFARGIPIRYLALLFGGGLASLPVLWRFVLKEYQKRRILVFLDPYVDPLGAGYNVIQARIAVGSGGLWGKGFMEGTQSKLRFLPEPHTDFIFSVFAEEFGFFPSALVVVLFFLLLLRLLWVADGARDGFGKLLVVGIFSFLLLQFFENIAMTMGLAPVTGITLPFFSYGGSALLTVFMSLGLVESVRRGSV